DLLRDDLPVVGDLLAPFVVPAEADLLLLLGLQALVELLHERLGLLDAPGGSPHGRLDERRGGRDAGRLHEAPPRDRSIAVRADRLRIHVLLRVSVTPRHHAFATFTHVWTWGEPRKYQDIVGPP